MNPIIFRIIQISDERGGLYNIATNDNELGALNYPAITAGTLPKMKEVLTECFATDERSVIFKEEE